MTSPVMNCLLLLILREMHRLTVFGKKIQQCASTLTELNFRVLISQCYLANKGKYLVSSYFYNGLVFDGDHLSMT